MRLLALSLLSAAFCGLSVDANLSTLSEAAARSYAFVAEQSGWSRAGGPSASPEGDFITARVERGSVEEAVTATGSLKPVETVEIGSQLAGEVAKLFVDFNDEVHAGQPLAQLDQQTLKARVDQAQSSLNVAQATLAVQEARLDRARIDLDNAQASRDVLVAKLENAQALSDAAGSYLSRQKALKASNAVSAATLDTAQTEVATKGAFLKETTSMLDLHRFTVEGAEADLRRLEAELAQARAELPLREAALRVAQIDLDRATIRSPIDGVVIGRFISQGQTIADGLESRTIFTVARDLARMEIHARVDESDIGRLRPGQTATFSVDAHPGRRFEAVVRQVRKAAEMSQNVVTYTVVLTTENKGGLLLPGMTAVVRIVTDHADDVIKVPLAALRFHPAGKASAPEPAGLERQPAVWVLADDGRIRRVPVATGPTNADQAVLTGGLVAEADRVVVGQASAAPERGFLGLRTWF